MPRITKRTGDVIVWVLLLSMPYWIGWAGGYTSLGTRVLVLGLAAMALNFLLGFTGVLSFGHAAYFGLGAYGAGMTISTWCRTRCSASPSAFWWARPRRRSSAR